MGDAAQEKIVEFVLLGPVGAWAGGSPVDVGHQRQRSVLAALLADVGRPVSAESLVDRVWGAEPPDGARRSLHSYIARIRQLLAGLAEIDPAVGRVRRQSGGYLLDADPMRVDTSRFRALVDRAARAGVTPEARAASLREALGLWRGEPFGGVSSEWLTRMRDTWIQHRIDTAVAWADAETLAGNGAAPAAALLELAGEYPLVEPLAAALIRTLTTAGRIDEALERYHATRLRLSDELGADPGPELRRAHQLALRGAPQPAPAEDAGTAARTAPAQLPADIPAFTGRAAELARLDGLLDAGTDNHGEAVTAVLSAVSGAAGVGKTALAVRWAHRVADRFPDGQVYLNLRGYDRDRPVAPADALARLLEILGVPGHEVPLNVDDRAGRLRTALAGRRLLLLLDNAGTAEQVRPLLPGNGSCAVVVTSRDSLAGLVATQGAQRIDIGPLRHDEAFALLRRLIGARVDEEPDAAATLVAQCCRLPLALRIAAELARSRSAVPLSGLVGELADERRRLDLLDAGQDPRAAIRAVHSWSAQHLPPPAVRAFRLFGLHPGPDFDAYAAAALASTDHAVARRDLEILCGAHLVERRGPGRYGMHDLLRAYAASLATAEDAAEDSRTAIRRLLDYYLGVSAAAVDTLHPGEAHRRIGTPPRPACAPGVSTVETALAWLDAERPVLVEVAGYAAANGWPEHSVALSPILLRYLAGGHHADALVVHALAREAARRTNDPAGEARALLGLAGTHRLTGRYERAAPLLGEALALFERVGDDVGRARALGDLGGMELWLGHHAPALRHLEGARDLFRAVGDRCGEARAEVGVGVVFRQQGSLRRAALSYRRGLELFRREGDLDGEAQTLINLGDVGRRLDDVDAAARDYARARELFHRCGARSGVAHALAGLGGVHLRRGHYDEAAACFGEALAICRDQGDKHLETWVLNDLGEVSAEAGEPADALGHHGAAHAVAAAIGEPAQRARADAGLGRAHLALGDRVRARRHYRRALDVYADLDPAEAVDIRARLADLR